MSEGVMRMHSIVMDGLEYVMIPRAQWDRVSSRVTAPDLLHEPAANADGSYSVQHVRVMLCNKIIRGRNEAGMTQAQLAKRAGIRVETISRLESGKHIPATRTMERIEKALAAHAA